MVFDSAVCACCVDEIASVAVGRVIREVTMPRRLDLVLELELPGPVRHIVISAEAERARMHLVASPPPATGKSYPMAAFARKHLVGSRVVAVVQEGFDRVGRIVVESRNPRLLDPACCVLAELMGKHSNILLLNNVDQVLEAAKHITTDLSRVRPVLPHTDYVPPPTAIGRDPRTASAKDVIALLRGDPHAPVARSLARAFDGMSRLLTEELCFRARVASDAAPDTLRPERLQALAETFAAIMEQIGSRRWEKVVYPTDRGPLPYPIRLDHLASASEPVGAPLLSLAVADAAEAHRARAETLSRRAGALAAVRSAITRIERRRVDLERQSDATEAHRLRRLAESLLASLALIPRGASDATVPDPYASDGATLVVPLDPKRTPADNANRLFDRARRLDEGARRVPELLSRVQHDLDGLVAVRGRLEAAGTLGDVLAAVAEAARYGVRLGDAANPRSGDVADEFPSRVSADGFDILYGRNAAQSEELLRNVAAPTDIWLHARDQRGGHVIIRARKQPERVPKRTLEEAARLAAFLSKARHSSLVPVDYTLRKYVRKARKSARGLFIFEREKTLMVEPLRSADEAG